MGTLLREDSRWLGNASALNRLQIGPARSAKPPLRVRPLLPVGRIRPDRPRAELRMHRARGVAEDGARAQPLGGGARARARHHRRLQLPLLVQARARGRAAVRPLSVQAFLRLETPTPMGSRLCADFLILRKLGTVSAPPSGNGPSATASRLRMHSSELCSLGSCGAGQFFLVPDSLWRCKLHLV